MLETSLTSTAVSQALSNKIMAREKQLTLTATPKNQFTFASELKAAIDSVNQTQANASDKINAVQLGQSDDLVGAIIASQKASLNFSALVQVRNKVVSGLEEMLRMPV